MIQNYITDWIRGQGSLIVRRSICELLFFVIARLITRRVKLWIQRRFRTGTFDRRAFRLSAAWWPTGSRAWRRTRRRIIRTEWFVGMSGGFSRAFRGTSQEREDLHVSPPFTNFFEIWKWKAYILMMIDQKRLLFLNLSSNDSSRALVCLTLVASSSSSLESCFPLYFHFGSTWLGPGPESSGLKL